MYFKLARFFTILSLFAITIVSKGTLFPFIVGKYAWFRGSIGLALISFLLGLLFSVEKESYWERAKKVIRSPLGIAVGVFVLVFLLAGLFGFDPKNSFWSNFERGEGGVQIIHLYLFFVLLTTLFRDEAGWRKVLGWAVFVGFLSVLYGLLGSFGVAGFIGSEFQGWDSYRLQGSLGNPSYVAVYSIFLLFYVSYLLITSGRKKIKKEFIKTGLFIFSALVFVVAFVLAATRGSFLGVLVSLFLSLVFVMIVSKKLRKPLGTIILCGTILFGVLFYFKDAPLVKNLPGSRIFDISLSATTFGHRAIMWKTAIEGFKERPVLGWGPENFYQIFDRHFNTDYFKPADGFGAWFDRAHSFIFDYLAETGILGLAAFLGIFGVFYFQFFKKTLTSVDDKPTYADKNQRKSANNQGSLASNPWSSVFIKGLFFALPIAYFIQGLVLFDILVTYINFLFFLAFANYHFLSHEDLGVGNQHKSARISINQR